MSLPKDIYAGRRLAIEKSDHLGVDGPPENRWWVAYSPRNGKSACAEGPWHEWVELAHKIIALDAEMAAHAIRTSSEFLERIGAIPSAEQWGEMQDRAARDPYLCVRCNKPSPTSHCPSCGRGVNRVDPLPSPVGKDPATGFPRIQGVKPDIIGGLKCNRCGQPVTAGSKCCGREY